MITERMDYNHSETNARLRDVTRVGRVSPLKKFFQNANPLKQQHELEREKLQQRPSRAVRYLNERVFAVGDREIEERSFFEGVEVAGSAFLSGFVFMGFLATPLACLRYSMKGANMASSTLVPDMVSAGIKNGMRAGVSWGAMLGIFRGTEYALSGKTKLRWYFDCPTCLTCCG